MQPRELTHMIGVPHLGVIGRVTPWNDNKTIIETGKGAEGGGWEKSGHVVLLPKEREKLITVLESHQGYRMLKVGEEIEGGAVVLAVQYLNATADDGRLRGTVLAWDGHEREYIVWTADSEGNVKFGTHTHDSQRALNAYITRVNEHLYTHFNATPPTLTFAHVADRDKLKG